MGWWGSVYVLSDAVVFVIGGGCFESMALCIVLYINFVLLFEVWSVVYSGI